MTNLWPLCFYTLTNTWQIYLFSPSKLNGLKSIKVKWHSKIGHLQHAKSSNLKLSILKLTILNLSWALMTRKKWVKCFVYLLISFERILSKDIQNVLCDEKLFFTFKNKLSDWSCLDPLVYHFLANIMTQHNFAWLLSNPYKRLEIENWRQFGVSISNLIDPYHQIDLNHDQIDFIDPNLKPNIKSSRQNWLNQLQI